MSQKVNTQKIHRWIILVRYSVPIFAHFPTHSHPFFKSTGFSRCPLPAAKSPPTVSSKGWPLRCPHCLCSFLHMLVTLRRSHFSSPSPHSQLAYLFWFLFLESSCSAKQSLNRDSNDSSFTPLVSASSAGSLQAPMHRSERTYTLRWGWRQRGEYSWVFLWPSPLFPYRFLPLLHIQCLPCPSVNMEQMRSKWKTKWWSFLPLGTTKLWWGPDR